MTGVAVGSDADGGGLESAGRVAGIVSVVVAEGNCSVGSGITRKGRKVGPGEV